ncbi:energy transducer TonB [Mesonia ostreae]|uniref:Energy transducer TonB n=1 Tax=Mesonia ostreae TaxID=861110 RepID=A0ABU2KMG7_9FLAO|nr:energy transducer TonB [Mesonia ostreae]MDT0295853.1 energy transducer TonB [Mesonia ostreae]
MLQNLKFSRCIALPLLAFMISVSSCSVNKSNGDENHAKLSQYDKEKIKEAEIAKFRKDIQDSLQKSYSATVKNLNTDVDAVPYSAIDNVPAYQGCDQSLSPEEIKKCTSAGITQFVNSNFDTKGVEQFAQEGSNRVYVRFTIDKDGNVKDVDSRASHPKLSEEAKRVVYSMPKLQPGKHKGEVVNVLYSLPIVFQMK